MGAYQDDELLGSFAGQLEHLYKKEAELKSEGKANRFVHGELPEDGSEVEINGLKYYVYSHTDGGMVVLKLKKIK